MDWLTDTKSVRPSLAYQQQKWPTNQTVHISVFQIQHMMMDSRRTNWLCSWWLTMPLPNKHCMLILKNFNIWNLKSILNVELQRYENDGCQTAKCIPKQKPGDDGDKAKKSGCPRISSVISCPLSPVQLSRQKCIFIFRFRYTFRKSNA